MEVELFAVIWAKEQAKQMNQANLGKHPLLEWWSSIAWMIGMQAANVDLTIEF